jgi:hypothetical protein
LDRFRLQTLQFCSGRWIGSEWRWRFVRILLESDRKYGECNPWGNVIDCNAGFPDVVSCRTPDGREVADPAAFPPKYPTVPRYASRRRPWRASR